jgi:hypothetical protein
LTIENLGPYQTVAWDHRGCRSSPPEEIRVAGVVISESGSPLPNEVLCQSGVQAVAPVQGDGTFTLSLVRGNPCFLHAETAEETGRLHFDADEPPETLVLEMVPKGFFSASVDRFSRDVDGLFEEEEDRLEMVYPYVVALEDPRLNPESRALLLSWRAQEEDQREELLESLDRLEGGLRRLTEELDADQIWVQPGLRQISET